MPAARKIGEDALTGPAMPESMEYLWRWYTELAQGKSEGMLGVGPLTWVDIDAWARHMQRSPEPHEVEALFRIDLTVRVASTVRAPTKGKPDGN